MEKTFDKTTIEEVVQNITGQTDFNQSFEAMLKDYFEAKIFQLKTQIAQLESKCGLLYFEFEKKSAKWENGSSYEIEQEYYAWGELMTELDHFTKLNEEWK